MFSAFFFYPCSVALLSQGRLLEHGRVANLLADGTSEFRKLVVEAGLVAFDDKKSSFVINENGSEI